VISGWPVWLQPARSIAVSTYLSQFPGQRTASRIFWFTEVWAVKAQRYFSGFGLLITFGSVVRGDQIPELAGIETTQHSSRCR